MILYHGNSVEEREGEGGRRGREREGGRGREREEGRREREIKKQVKVNDVNRLVYL